MYRDNNEIFDKLMYLAYRLENDGDARDLRSCKNLDAWKALKGDADVHAGDCTSACGTCIRCMFQRYEIEAENIYLFLRPYLKDEACK